MALWEQCDNEVKQWEVTEARAQRSPGKAFPESFVKFGLLCSTLPKD